MKGKRTKQTPQKQLKQRVFLIQLNYNYPYVYKVHELSSTVVGERYDE